MIVGYLLINIHCYCTHLPPKLRFYKTLAMCLFLHLMFLYPLEHCSILLPVLFVFRSFPLLPECYFSLLLRSELLHLCLELLVVFVHHLDLKTLASILNYLEKYDRLPIRYYKIRQQFLYLLHMLFYFH